MGMWHSALVAPTLAAGAPRAAAAAAAAGVNVREVPAVFVAF
jgi:hypothetical protein